MSFFLALVVAFALLAFWRAALAVLLVVVVTLLLVGMATVMSEMSSHTGTHTSVSALHVG